MPRSESTTAAATLAVRMAGWVFAVSPSSSSGPSKQSFESRKPSASSARLQTAAAAGEDSAKARPMPTACEPCPGKRKAIFIGYQRMSAAPQVNPPPKAAIRTRSPGLSRFAAHASSRAT